MSGEKVGRGNGSSGTARCNCGWEVDASTENQAEAAAIGHSYDTGHLDMEVNGHFLQPGSERGDV